jgi:hypothetical protein
MGLSFLIFQARDLPTARDELWKRVGELCAKNRTSNPIESVARRAAVGETFFAE